MSAAQRELEQAHVSTEPEVVIADAGFWNEQQMDKLAADGIAVLVSPESGRRKGQRPGWSGGRYEWMRRLLATDHGREIYQQRKQVSPCLVTPNTTESSPSFTVAAAPPCAPSGGY